MATDRLIAYVGEFDASSALLEVQANAPPPKEGSSAPSSGMLIQPALFSCAWCVQDGSVPPAGLQGIIGSVFAGADTGVVTKAGSVACSNTERLFECVPPICGVISYHPIPTEENLAWILASPGALMAEEMRWVDVLCGRPRSVQISSSAS